MVLGLIWGIILDQVVSWPKQDIWNAVIGVVVVPIRVYKSQTRFAFLAAFSYFSFIQLFSVNLLHTLTVPQYEIPPVGIFDFNFKKEPFKLVFGKP